MNLLFLLSTVRYIKLLSHSPSNAKLKKINKKYKSHIFLVQSSDNDDKNLRDQKSQKINNFHLHLHEIKITRNFFEHIRDKSHIKPFHKNHINYKIDYTI